MPRSGDARRRSDEGVGRSGLPTNQPIGDTLGKGRVVEERGGGGRRLRDGDLFGAAMAARQRAAAAAREEAKVGLLERWRRGTLESPIGGAQVESSASSVLCQLPYPSLLLSSSYKP